MSANQNSEYILTLNYLMSIKRIYVSGTISYFTAFVGYQCRFLKYDHLPINLRRR